LHNNGQIWKPQNISGMLAAAGWDLRHKDSPWGALNLAAQM